MEDSLANQRSARQLGLRTVWMQGHLAPGGSVDALALKEHVRPAQLVVKLATGGLLGGWTVSSRGLTTTE